LVQGLSQGDTLAAWNLPRAGEEVLPPRVRQGLGLIRSQGLKSYGLSDALRGDVIFYQRMVEASWPARLDPSATRRLSLEKQFPPATNCSFLRSGGQLVLWTCP